jgi:Methylmalonic aciduria and homocystinuria type D protein
MEYHVFSINGAFKREVVSIFPVLSSSNEINIVIFFQDAGINLFSRSDVTEKDKCLINFFDVSEKLCDELNDYWCDYIDPSSGLPMKTNTLRCFSDVEACTRLMKMDYSQSGGCMVLTHHKFGQSLYPSSFITNAPESIIKYKLSELINKFNKNI